MCDSSVTVAIRCKGVVIRVGSSLISSGHSWGQRICLEQICLWWGFDIHLSSWLNLTFVRCIVSRQLCDAEMF